MNYTTVDNPVYVSADNTLILCDVQFTGFDRIVPFAASASDVEPHGRQLYQELVDGKYGAIAPYVPASLAPQQLYITAINNGLIISSTSDPSLRGTYQVGDGIVRDVMSEVQYISTFNEFTTGQPSLVWADNQGNVHMFKSLDLFMAFAKAVAQYVSGCKQALIILQNGGTASFPSNTVNIG